jgi:hypothetical protein
MVTLSQAAIARIEQLTGGGEPMDWFLLISWRKGTAENWRGDDGIARWSRLPDDGWVAELGGYNPGTVAPDLGTPLLRNVRLLVQERPEPPVPFPGGEVFVENGEFKVRLHAI